MESMLFTTLTAYEEASLSGGNTPTPPPAPKPKHVKPKYDKYGKLVIVPIKINVNVVTVINNVAIKGDGNLVVIENKLTA